MGVRLAGAVLLALLTSGCSGGEEESAAERVRTLATVPLPDGPWRAVEPDLPEPERVDHDLGETVVWRAESPPMHAVSYSLRVPPGRQEFRCVQASLWLMRTAEGLPGEPEAEHATMVVPQVQAACRRALDRADREGGPGSVGSDSFASYPAHVDGDNRYGAYLTLRWSGPRRDLVVNVWGWQA